MFNRPVDFGRAEAVLIFMHHAFEMLLKSLIYQSRGTITDRGERTSYTFKRCIGIAKSDLNGIDEDDALTLSFLDDLRDCAMHNLLDLTEQSLFLQARASVTLFDKLLNAFYGERLAEHLPVRVLPISTDPPQDMMVFLDSEFAQIKSLLRPRMRRASDARNRLRAFAILESNMSSDGGQPTDRELDGIIKTLRSGASWNDILPGIANLRLETSGDGPGVSIRFTRQPGAAPVRIIREGSGGGEDAMLVREIDLTQRYSMTPTTLAENLGLTRPKTLALVRHLELQSDNDCYREIQMGAATYQRYSPLALNRLREALKRVNMDDVWREHRARHHR